MNFSYTYAYKEKLYIGASIGVPKLTYSSTTTHVEYDDKDSMRVTITSGNSYTTTYTDSLPGVYPDKLGFNSLNYTEYFSTSGSGVNFKIGAVVRLTDYIRVGAYYHTPTIYTLRDVYYNKMSATFDKNKTSPLETKYPDDKGGYFDYKIVTPAKMGLSAGFIINRIAAVGVEYELVDYRTAQLLSTNISDFAGVNTVIKHKYAIGSNVRAGVEWNVKPVMLRAGYNMQGSPFGNAFTGSFVRHTVSLGAGFRSKSNFFADLVWYKNVSTEDYYMFTSIPTKSVIRYNNSMLAATVGVKF
jgi:long-subunit fatty acid transport protein